MAGVESDYGYENRTIRRVVTGENSRDDGVHKKHQNQHSVSFLQHSSFYFHKNPGSETFFCDLSPVSAILAQKNGALRAIVFNPPAPTAC
ncbi:hypothetical protein ACP56U_19560 [Kosakonia cowanii]